VKVERVADRVGVVGAIAAALCCAGNVYIVGALSAVGLVALRKDAILWPVMLVSLAIGVWGFWLGWRAHGKLAPLLLAVLGAVAVAVGVIVVHGFPAMEMIYGGAIGLGAASILNFFARRAHPTSGQSATPIGRGGA
jgi:mercuric ion transport protein